MTEPAGAALVTGVGLLHRTVYHYDRAVQVGPQWIRLRPLPDPRIPAPAFRLSIDPAPTSLHWMVDPLGNMVARAALAGGVERLTIEVAVGVDLVPRNPFDFVLDAHAVGWPFVYEAGDAAVLRAYLEPGAAGPLTLAVRAATGAGQDTVALVLALGAEVCRRVAYIVRMEAGVWTPEQTLAEARGSCRDSAWLLVQLLRLHGIAARFVSGYLVQLDGEAGDDAELHAWADAYLPGAGWIGIDATSGLLTAAGHVALAAAPTPEGAAPLQGTVERAEVRLETTMIVERQKAGERRGG